MTPYKDRLVYMLEAPYVRSTNCLWEKKLAALCEDLTDCLLTRDEITRLVSYLKQQAETIPAARKALSVAPNLISGPDWAFYEQYGCGGIRIGYVRIGFRGVAKINGDTLDNYIARLDTEKIYQKYTRK